MEDLVPEALRQTIARVHGAAGEEWLAGLPALLADCRKRWNLELDAPFAALSFNLVVPGRRSTGAEIVLKLGVPCRELETEAAALELFDGNGAVRLLDRDTAHGVLLLERVIPGRTLGALRNDREATEIAADVMRSLRRDIPANHPFPSLIDWFGAFERLRGRFRGGTGPFPSDLIEVAEHTVLDLNDSSDDRAVLHGDLHHGNILLSQADGWVAIDPKGVVGDPGYEIGALLRNGLPARASDSAVVAILRERIAVLSDELRIPKERLAAWGFCHTVLSAVWSFEDSCNPFNELRLAKLMRGMRHPHSPRSL